MGRKKSNRPVRTRQLPTIPRIFDCPRCEATAIRISQQEGMALVECGNCLLKQTITDIKSIEEPVDIFGAFVDEYYNNIELYDTEQPEVTETPLESAEESSIPSPELEEVVEETTLEGPEEIEEEVEEESEEEEPAPMGFVPRTKGDVLKKKIKEKDKKKNKLTL